MQSVKGALQDRAPSMLWSLDAHVLTIKVLDYNPEDAHQVAQMLRGARSAFSLQSFTPSPSAEPSTIAALGIWFGS